MGAINTQWVKYYSDTLIWVVNSVLVPALIAIAFIVFLWGAYRYYIWNGADEAARAKGHSAMLYGVIGFVLLFSLWGIVNIFMGTLGLTAGTRSPAFPTIGGGTTAPGGSPSNPFGGTGLFTNNGTGGFVGGGGTPAQNAALQTAFQGYNSCIAVNSGYVNGVFQCQALLDAYQQTYATVFPSSEGVVDNRNEGTGGTGGATVVPGCINPQAENYNPSATTDNGSCTFAASEI